ncbi:hypothetical protein C8Q74DRAFT_874095 [Fomes fomentarius]|nr:hypothetical protein C8Q74DRAFT_874095 [Fomes fomentarius]
MATLLQRKRNVRVCGHGIHGVDRGNVATVILLCRLNHALAEWWRYYQVVILRDLQCCSCLVSCIPRCNLVQLCRLRDPKIQEEYRAFIHDKVDEYREKYPYGLRPSRNSDAGGEDEESHRNRREMEENLLILFRKLREGLLSTQRRDAFALEVYETSLHLSALFNSPVQITSALSQLTSNLYVPFPISRDPTHCPRPPSGSGTKSSSTSNLEAARVPRTALASTLILLLHQLVQAYPSQTAFYTQLRQLHPSLLHLLRGTPPPPPPPLPHVHQTWASEDADSDLTESANASAKLSTLTSTSPSSVPGLAPLPLTASPPSIPVPSPRSQSQSQSLSQPSASFASGSESPSSFTVNAKSRDPNSAEHDAFAVNHERTTRAHPHASAHVWILDLARCLRARNYARLEGLTRPSAFSRFVTRERTLLPRRSSSQSQTQRQDAVRDARSESRSELGNIGTGEEEADGRRRQHQHQHQQGQFQEPEPGREEPDLALAALGTLVEALLEKARAETWKVLRTAYREVSLRASAPVPVDVPASVFVEGERAVGTGTTGEWLAQCLVLRRAVGDGNLAGAGSAGKVCVGVGDRVVRDVEAWLEARAARGEVRRKEGEGMDGRWILVKA